jgi:hypothetical protein
MFSSSDEVIPMADKYDQKGSIRFCNENTSALREVNQKILYYLDRIPLKTQRETVQLNRLIAEQERLVRVRLKGHIPLRVEIFNDNERHRAHHLRRRFREAERSDRIKAPSLISVMKEKKTIYFGNKRSPTIHLPECRWVKKISSQNIVLFNSRQEAVDRGYIPCKICRP